MNTSVAKKCLFLEITPLHGPYIYGLTVATCVLNATFALPCVLGSGLILLAMWRNPNLDSPSHVFLRFLALSDFVTGLIVQPCYVIHKVAWLTGHTKLDCMSRLITETVAWVSAAASCCLISVISFDRYLAIHLHMRYGHYITSSRAFKAVMYILIGMVITSSSRYWAMDDNRPFIIIGVAGILNAVLIVIFAYMYIFIVLRRHKQKISAQAQVQSGAEQMDESATRARANRRSAMSLSYVVALFIVTYVPFAGVLVSGLLVGNTAKYEAAYDVTRTICFISSALDPVIYCWKIREVCDEVAKTWQKLWDRLRMVDSNPVLVLSHKRLPVPYK